MYKRQLAVCAHEDDELLGLGALLAASPDVGVLCTSRSRDPRRAGEYQAALECLGARGVNSVGELADRRPAQVLSFGLHDGHQEHRRAGALAYLLAIRLGVPLFEFGVFSPVGMRTATHAYCYGSEFDKSDLFETLYPSQQHLRRAVVALGRWERYQARQFGLGGAAELYRIRLASGADCGPIVGIRPEPEAGVYRELEYFRQRRATN